MTQQQQEDGCFPRITASSLSDGSLRGTIVSLVGKIVANDGAIWTVQTADGTTVPVEVGEENTPPPCHFLEIMGAVREDGSKKVDFFIARELGDDFDMDIYREMLKIQSNPKFGALFGPTAGLARSV
eukprot:CAMPEP_0113313298 /NCGR_PEP_ID=MMETSP0010_2-20120614/9778_1 /TAXON_ID=216773 ORGANISM="Corethron hystrix, Strain 308" /NCGR_SAMPLE_ID=MMETSP0010_2 /ASSEMBLY_ACC=CAM_ASM_000155 /LENGTH=126 /DNA_ID=CAMNT_0000169283 /DNA_START=51 /DNA_END=431 /DNA_ORIENTATION=+ /assembly_acc=CAM_ASM_000155